MKNEDLWKSLRTKIFFDYRIYQSEHNSLDSMFSLKLQLSLHLEPGTLNHFNIGKALRAGKD
jgi:hypothetical protein